ncbi:hypothetical protein DYL80_21485 [Salmonella enterica subsp. enterica serovar Minnesota]|nr:hypothetical protein [Salmonella enterica subsp. enterica serovar Minnesota]
MLMKNRQKAGKYGAKLDLILIFFLDEFFQSMPQIFIQKLISHLRQIMQKLFDGAKQPQTACSSQYTGCTSNNKQ